MCSSDLVVSVANAGGYASTAVAAIGARVSYCDVDPSNLLMSGKTLEIALAALPEPPSAIAVTHLSGAVAPCNEIVPIAKAHGIPLVEDCAQAFGARNSFGMAGGFGDISTTSFFPTKNLGGFGDAGAVFTRDSSLAERLRSLRQYGWVKKYEVAYGEGRNSRMDELQAALLRIKLRRVDEGIHRRAEIHRDYEASFEAVPGHYLLHSSTALGGIFSPHLTVALFPEREKVRDHFARHSIATEVHYPIPDHLQKPAKSSNLGVVLPTSESAARQVLTMPNFSTMTSREVGQVRKAIESLSS